MPRILGKEGHRGGRLTLLALVVGLVGMVLVGVAIAAQRSAPQPHSAGRINTPSPSTDAPSSPGTSPAKPNHGPLPLPASRPVFLSIPTIGVRTPVFKIGLTPVGALAVPHPGPNLNHAAWFKNSPTPGQPGASIIEGHVDSAQGISVFFKLGALHPGEQIYVRRADGTRLTFTINAIRDFKKAHFPTNQVYGGKNLSTPQLRLITCSDFDQAIHHHIGNEVVYAHLTHVRPAR